MAASVGILEISRIHDRNRIVGSLQKQRNSQNGFGRMHLLLAMWHDFQDRLVPDISSIGVKG